MDHAAGRDVARSRRRRCTAAAGRSSPSTGFHVGLIDGGAGTETQYGRPVSFGIRRCEFDHYLLERSGARVEAGAPVTSLRRDGGHWIVNGRIRTPLLVGAGGHFCPVARHVNADGRDQAAAAPVVVAQEAEFRVEPTAAGAVQGEAPELYFCRDFKGYGWCFRKGSTSTSALGASIAGPCRGPRLNFWRSSAQPAGSRAMCRRAGGATRTPCTTRRAGASSDSGVMLIGDAAALAYAQSGEGIRPAIESGLMAAAVALQADGDYSAGQLEPYADRLRARFGPGSVATALSRAVPDGFGAAVGRRLLSAPAFVRHVVLDRWFLHRHQPALGVIRGSHRS